MSVNTSANPLLKHFRQPAIYIKLPSQGKFWPSEALDMPFNEEIPVYPMTAKDEIILRTPDALLNGQGVVDVIQSCCPNIKDAWAMPSVDVDAVLIAIRIATYGTQMDMDLVCPHCQHEHSVALDLSTVLDKIKLPNYAEKLSFNGVNIKLHPQQYFSINRTNQIQYEEQRIINALNSEALDDDAKITEYSLHLTKIVDLNIEILVNSTEYIELEEDSTVVNDPAYIKEYFLNCDSSIVHQLQTFITKLNSDASIPPIDNSCPSCSKEYSLPMEFDYARFFANAS